MFISPAWKTQIALSINKKVIILGIYLDFSDGFSTKLATKLPKRSNINKHLINPKSNKQLLYNLIYSLESIKLKIFLAYIETTMANNFICLFKSSTKALIFFGQKSNSSFWLYIDYQGLNNQNIKNWYFLSIIGKLLHYLH